MKEYVVKRRFEVVQYCLIKAESIDQAKERAENDTDKYTVDVIKDIEGDYEVTSQFYQDIHEYKGKDID